MQIKLENKFCRNQEDMTKIQINILHLLSNKSIRIFCLALFSTLIAVGFYKYIERYKLVHSPFYKNLQGDYQLVLDSSYIDRYFDVTPSNIFVVTIQIQQDHISLPNLRSYTNKKMSLFGYSWEIVSTNPDTIFIDAYPHCLHGKYRVSFEKFPSGSLGYTSTDFVYLDNDSTHLCLMKVKQ